MTTIENNTRAGRLLSVEDLCDYLGVSKNFVYRQIQAGNLRGRRIARQWRFRPEDVEQFVEASPTAD